MFLMFAYSCRNKLLHKLKFWPNRWKLDENALVIIPHAVVLPYLMKIHSRVERFHSQWKCVLQKKSGWVIRIHSIIRVHSYLDQIHLLLRYFSLVGTPTKHCHISARKDKIIHVIKRSQHNILLIVQDLSSQSTCSLTEYCTWYLLSPCCLSDHLPVS